MAKTLSTRIELVLIENQPLFFAAFDVDAYTSILYKWYSPQALQ